MNKNITKKVNVSFNQSKLTINKNNTDSMKQAEELKHHAHLVNAVAALKIKEIDDKVTEEAHIKLLHLSQKLEMKKSQLDIINRRIKDIGLLATQHRLIKQQEEELEKLETAFKTSNLDEVLNNLTQKQDIYCDCFNTKNVDFGYTSTDGFGKIKEAIDEALELLEDKLPSETEMEQTEKLMEKLEEHRKEKCSIEKNLQNITESLPEMSRQIINITSERMSNAKPFCNNSIN